VRDGLIWLRIRISKKKNGKEIPGLEIDGEFF